MTVSYNIYKIKDFIRRTEKGEINIQKSLNTVARKFIQNKKIGTSIALLKTKENP